MSFDYCSTREDMNTEVLKKQDLEKYSNDSCREQGDIFFPKMYLKIL